MKSERLIASDIRFGRNTIEVVLADGRRVIAPLSFYPTLASATPRQRRAWEFWGDEGKGGYAVEWPDLDLQLSIDSIVAGRREHVPPPGFHEWLKKQR